jgi:hypothetical protein
MFDIRTKSAKCIVWLAIVTQLLQPPAVEWLHTGCNHHLHQSAGLRAPSLATAVEVFCHWLNRSHCCHHSHSGTTDETGCVGPHRAGEIQFLKRISSTEGIDDRNASDRHSSSDAPCPPHDSQQCVVCHVIFAARLIGSTVKLPQQTALVHQPVVGELPVADIGARFKQPPRGPPVI